MLVSQLILEITNLNLPYSQGVDLCSYLLDVDYDSLKNSRNLEIEISDDLVSKKTKYKNIQELLNAISEGYPISYITFRREFYGREFLVNENTLIPRVCSETLIETVLNFINNSINNKSNNPFFNNYFKKNEQKENLRILDLCTGSGALGITVSKELEMLGIKVDLTLLDISSKAIDVAKENCKLQNIYNYNLQVEDLVNFNSEEKFHIIICNPPYIDKSSYNDLENSVKYEPIDALIAEDSGLFFYKFILSKFSLLCKYMGMIFFEIGYNQGQDLKNISKAYNLKCEIKKDYSNIDRVAIIYE